MRKWMIYVNFAANAAGSLISALTMLIVIATLSVENWGLSASILGIGQFVGAAVSFGTHTRLLREISVLESGVARERARIQSFARTAVGLAGLTIGAALSMLSPVVGATIVLCSGVFVSLGVTAPLIAQRRYASAGVVLVTEKLVALGMAVFATRMLGLGAVGLPVALGLAGVIAGALVTISHRSRAGGSRFGVTLREVGAIWGGSLHFGIAALAPSALLLDVALVSMIAGQTEAGLYAAGSRLMAPLSIAATTIVQILMPALATKRISDFVAPSRSRVVVWGGVTVLAAGSLMLLVPPLVILILGPEYQASSGIIRVFIGNAAVALLTRTLATVLQAWHQERVVAQLVAAQVFVALAGILVASNQYGAFSAALALLASNCLLAAALLLAVRKIWNASTTAKDENQPKDRD